MIPVVTQRHNHFLLTEKRLSFWRNSLDTWCKLGWRFCVHLARSTMFAQLHLGQPRNLVRMVFATNVHFQLMDMLQYMSLKNSTKFAHRCGKTCFNQGTLCWLTCLPIPILIAFFEWGLCLFKHSECLLMLVCGNFYVETMEICYFFDHLGYKGWPLVGRNCCQQVRMLSHAIGSDSGNCFSILTCCKVGK